MFQLIWPAFPTLCSAQVLLVHVLLGQRPSLHSLRWRSPAFVRLLRRYYATVRLPAAVHVGLMAHRFLPPVRGFPAADSDGVSRFSRVEFLCVRGVFDSAGPRCTRATAHRVVAFRLTRHRPLPDLEISELNVPPAYTPVNASSTTSRLPSFLNPIGVCENHSRLRHRLN